MNAEEFVNAITKACQESVAYEFELLEHRPTSGKPPHWAEFARCIHGLPAADKDVVRALLRYTAEGCLFNLLMYIDNSVRLTASEGSFELWFVNPDGTKVLLNDPDGDLLCDLFNISQGS